MKLLKGICKELGLRVAIGSKTVGKELGRQEDPSMLGRVMGKWRQVWAGDDVREQEELLIPVAVDDRSLPQDWVFVEVRACEGGRLGAAQRLRVVVFDAMQRVDRAKRIARNVDALVRGVRSRSDCVEPEVECVGAPECRVSAQRMLCAFGLLARRVAVAAGTSALDSNSDAFVPNVGQALRAVFRYLRNELSERGLRDVAVMLKEPGMCRKVLQMMSTVPSGVPGVDACIGAGAGEGAVFGRDVHGREERRGVVVAQGKERCALRVATWNIAGGHRSAQAPAGYSAEDQRAAVMDEVQRWVRVFSCDVVALQECESAEAYRELLGSHELAGAVEARETRGWVHVYVRRGLSYERVVLSKAKESVPCVVVRVDVDTGERGLDAVVVAGVHLPTGDCSTQRRCIVEQAVSSCEVLKEQVLVSQKIWKLLVLVIGEHSKEKN